MNTIIDMLNSAYALKRCGAVDFAKDFRPCLNFHIHQCKGVCRGDVSKEVYRESVDKALEFLQGKDKDLLKTLQEKMYQASEDMLYEQAAVYRDNIEAVKAISQKQRVVLSSNENLDIILLSAGLQGAHAVLFTVREGKLSGRESFYLGDIHEDTREAVIADFIKQYYYANVLIPKEILLASMPEDADLLQQWLTKQRGAGVQLLVPARGEKRALLDLVRKDVDEMVKDLDERAKRQIEKEQAAKTGLADVFGTEMAAGIHRVEAYDISNINGIDSVGGMVVFEDGRPDKKSYRRFKIKTIEGADDTGSLQEVLFRRFKEAQAGNPGFTHLPDLILMDGGLGQVHAAEAVLKALRIDIPIAGMAKDDKHRTRALIYKDEELELKPHRELFAYVGTIQEEVHRFAIEYHRKLRGKTLSRSVLDGIPGIGEKRKLALLAEFGSVDAIKAADVYKLAEAPGMNMAAAESVYNYFANKENS